MKLLLVNISLDAKLGGGTAERTRRLAVSLAEAGHDCNVFAMSGNSWEKEFGSHSIDFYITPRLGSRFPIPIPNPLRIWRSTVEADAIHIMGYWNLLSVCMGFVARLTHTPYVLCPAGEFASLDAPGPVKKAFHQLVGRQLIRHSSGFVAITDLERKVIARVANVSLDKIVVIPNAVGFPVVPDQLSRVDNLLPKRPFILFMGRLATVKGPDLLLDAYIKTVQAHDYDLVMAGPDFGMQAGLVEHLSNSSVLEKVHFLGHLNEDERNYVYQRAELLVIPSRSEAMSLVALEAGILGVPVLMTNTCGFDEVENIGGGKVVAATAEGISNGLQSMLKEPEKLKIQGQILKSYVCENFTWIKVAKRLTEWLKVLV